MIFVSPIDDRKESMACAKPLIKYKVYLISVGYDYVVEKNKNKKPFHNEKQFQNEMIIMGKDGIQGAMLLN